MISKLNSFIPQINADPVNNVFELEDNEVFDDEHQDVISVDGVFVMRFDENHEPQIIEITIPDQKILVEKVIHWTLKFLSLFDCLFKIADMQPPTKTKGIISTWFMNLVKFVGKAVLKAACERYI